jgi:hypothetical protein
MTQFKSEGFKNVEGYEGGRGGLHASATKNAKKREEGGHESRHGVGDGVDDLGGGGGGGRDRHAEGGSGDEDEDEDEDEGVLEGRAKGVGARDGGGEGGQSGKENGKKKMNKKKQGGGGLASLLMGGGGGEEDEDEEDEVDMGTLELPSSTKLLMVLQRFATPYSKHLLKLQVRSCACIQLQVHKAATLHCKKEE